MKQLVLLWRWLFHREQHTPQQRVPVSSKITRPLPGMSTYLQEAAIRARLEPDDEDDITNQPTAPIARVPSVDTRAPTEPLPAIEVPDAFYARETFVDVNVTQKIPVLSEK